MNTARLAPVFSVMALVAAMLLGCGPSAPPSKGPASAPAVQTGDAVAPSAETKAIAGSEQNDPAIKEAKDRDRGNDLPEGGKRRIDTSNGPVEISKEPGGAVVYKKL